MRWPAKVSRPPNERSGFLLFPKTINGETRWLEFARREVELRLTAGSGMPYLGAVRWVCV